MIPFAKTKAERLASGDPRLSIEERYPSFTAYYYQVAAAVNDFVAERLMLPEDANATFNRMLQRRLQARARSRWPRRSAMAFVDLLPVIENHGAADRRALEQAHRAR